MTAPMIDLSRHHFMRPIGEFVAFGTWVHNDEQEADEPALVVVPRYRRSGFKPCVVALSAAFKYDDPKYCVRSARIFLENLGMADSMSSCNTLATLIHDHLEDLLSMPLSPTSRVLVGEAQADTGGGIIQLFDHVATRQV
jgi:hypothetical protein